MDDLGGLLLVPPDRTQILGRASWKSRYVVVARRAANTSQATGGTRRRQGSAGYGQGVISGRVASLTPKSPARTPPAGEYCIFVYKSKDDAEPIQQWSISCVTDCQVQLVSNRKQGPVLPTLVITVSDKERRRRSSRAAGFISASKDAGTATLWFRTPPDDHHPSLQDWARFILSKRELPSAESPVSPVFASPFPSRSRDNSDLGPRPGSGSRPLHHKSSTATYSTAPRERPSTFSSESPSLRSKRSDISSPSSNNYNPQKILPFAIPEQHYTTLLPPLTSPGSYHGALIEGWTSAQGRSSALSSPTRGRDSLSSQAQYPCIYDAASPPAPGETILDRAFQLGQIPGAETYIPGQEKLSSIARFDALMREAEVRQKRQEAAAKAEQAGMRSAFEEDDSSGESDADESDAAAESDDDARSSQAPDDCEAQAASMSPGVERAPTYIADRPCGSPRPAVSRTHVSFHADAASARPRSPVPPPSRPRTAHARSRPSAGPLPSAPRLAPAAGSTSLDLPFSAAGGGGKKPAAPSPAAGQPGPGEKRLSSSSAKRLSFTDFTKRLSSTSSLLLVQTNASAGSSEVDGHPPSSAPRTNLTSAPPPPPPPRASGDHHDRRCGWRGSVGVEGGFL